MSKHYTDIIAADLAQDLCPTIEFDDNEEQEYELFDKYIDEQIADGSIVKHDKYSFIGKGWAEKVNDKLKLLGSSNRLIAVDNMDKRLDTKVKGQGAYFIMTKDGIDRYALIFTWAYNPFFMEKLKQ